MKLGDVVRLKSGGPWMTVIKAASGWCECVWMTDRSGINCGHNKSGFPEESLQLREEVVEAAVRKILAEEVNDIGEKTRTSPTVSSEEAPLAEPDKLYDGTSMCCSVCGFQLYASVVEGTKCFVLISPGTRCPGVFQKPKL